MLLNSILVVTDFSQSGDRSIERAARIAITHAATLRLLYAPSAAHPLCNNPARRLARAAQDLSRRPGLTVRTIREPATSLAIIARQSLGDDLLVIHDRQERNLRSLLWGQPVSPLTRLCNCPILLTRNAGRSRLDSVLVTVDFGAQPYQLAALACTLEKDAQIELFHAVSTVGEANLRQAEVPYHVLKTYRETCVEYAQKQLSMLQASLGANPARVRSVVEHGNPAGQVLARQKAIGADMLVVGTSRGRMVRDRLFGSTAHFVLRHATCDVLFVPHGYRSSTRALAMQRIDGERRTSAGVLGYTAGSAS